MLHRWLLPFVLVAAGCLQANPPNGSVTCADSDPKCPEGYECRDDNSCWKAGEYPDLAAPDLSTEGDGPNETMDLTAQDLARLPNKHKGEACTATDLCDTGNCVDGYCCDKSCSDPCMRCNVTGIEGTCSAVVAGGTPVHGVCTVQAASTCGTDGKCDGAGTCRKWPAGTLCQDSSCNQTTGAFTPASLCDGNGTCVASTGYNCAPYKCKDANACFSQCTDVNQCSSGNLCSGGRCGLLDNGRTCSTNSDCKSNVCVDGFCCDSACTGTCQSCNVPGKQGICTTNPAGQPLGAGKNCAGVGTLCGGKCDGNDPTACKYPGVSTQCNRTCKSTSTETDYACNGAGACSTTGTDLTCTGHFVCAGNACLTSCTKPTDCQTGFGCASGLCVPMCADGAKDGDETDVDCGGSCAKKCTPDQSCSGAGDCETGSCVGSLCALVSGPPNWLPSTAVPVAAAQGAATRSSDGRIIYIGGADGNGTFTIVQAFGPAGWSQLASLTTSRLNGAAATGSDGRIYAFGGAKQIFPDPTVTASMESYTTNAWRTEPSMSTPRNGLCGVTGPDARIYAISGEASSSTSESFAIGGSWRPEPALSVARVNLGCAVGIDGRIYAVGGQTASTYSSAVEARIPGGAWTRAADLPTPRHSAGVVAAPDGRIYDVGGIAASGNTTIVEAFSTKSNRWLSVASLAIARSAPAAVGFDGRIYAIAGGTGAGNQSSVEAYGPVVTVQPASGARGTAAAISGSNFAANATVSAYFGGSTNAAATGTSDATGKLSVPISFTVPSVPAATYTVTVVDNRSQYPVTVQFTVTP